jgi:hypothetical protein
MAADSHLDLSKLDQWHGLRPGMSRSEVRAAMIAAGLDPAGDASDAANLDIYDWGMELRFTTDGTDRLPQILLDDEDAQWAGQPLAGVPLDTALRTLGTAGDSARWRPEDAVDADDLVPPPAGPFSDEALLREGTVWLPSLRLGLVLCEGLVNQIVWRDAPDVPREMIGPVTPAQRQLSLRSDLAEHLRKEWVSHIKVEGPPADPRVYALGIACFLALVFIGWLSWLETKRWSSDAVMLTGKVLAMETLPGRLKQQSFRIEFLDPTGRPHETNLIDRDFYITPREIGQEVHLYYSKDDPPRVMGEFRVRDAAFSRYMPWAAGVGGVFVVGRLVLGLIPWKSKEPPTSDAGIVR